MKLLKFALGLLLTAALHGALVRFFPEFGRWLDLFLILVLFFSLDSTPAWSICEGALAGLAYDSLSSSLYGLHGTANTVVGYAAARLQQRLVMQRAFQVALLFALGAALQQTVLALLQFWLIAEAEVPQLLWVAGKMLLTGLGGTFLFALRNRFRTLRAEQGAERQRRLKIKAR